MGKYKKYAKTEQNSDQSNKNLPNDSTNNNNNQGNKMENKATDLNNSKSYVLWEILEAAKYFFIMCKNFLIPEGIPFKIFASFLVLEILYQGITIYLIKSVIHFLEDFFSIWNNFMHIYIYIVSNIQMIYIFICEGLLIFRFIHLKIYLFNKFNWLLNILSFIIIIFNVFEMKDLNYKVHRFYTKNLDNYASKNKLIKDHVVNEYINLHITKNEDYQNYEFCYELKAEQKVINNIKIQLTNIEWSHNRYTDIYTGCKNLSLKNETLFDPNSNNLFFKCDNKGDVSTAPNMCVSSSYRQKRFYAQIKMAFYEIFILILWNLYNSFSIRIIYKYFPNLKNEKQNNSEDNYTKKSQNSHSNKNINQTITFKDINDKEINNGNKFEEEEEEDEYEEEEDEENNKKEEKSQKDGYVKVFKMRKISKRKMKNYKKKKKRRYKEENTKNKNIYFDDEILNMEYYDGKNDNHEDSINNTNQDENDDLYLINNNNNKNKIKKKNINNKNKDKNVIDSDKDSDDDIDSEDDSSDDSEEEEEEEEDENPKYTDIEQIDIVSSLKRKIFENIESYQLWRRLYKYLFEKYIIRLKNKIRHIFYEIDKSIREKKD